MKIKSVFLAAILTAFLCHSGNLLAYSDGNGTPVNPYKIANIDDFHQLTAAPADWSLSFILTANIELIGFTFTKAPIAPDTDNTNSGFQGTQFTGIFDGNGHTISNLTITASTQDYVGLFGYVGPGGQIRNLGVENANIAGRVSVGGLAGGNSGSVTSCYAACSVGGGTFVGGLVGYSLGGLLTTCYATGSVSGTGDYVGGLMGYNWGSSLTTCYAAGLVSGGTSVGGLVGENAGTLTSCFWDINTSNQLVGVGSGTSAGATGKSTVEMMTLSTFTSAGWDFSATDGDSADWKMKADSYPRLAWERIAANIADLNADGVVDYLDFDILADQWLIEKIPADLAPQGGDGMVNFTDFAVFGDQWNITVDTDDLYVFTEQWLKTGPSDYSADISPLPDGDGLINFADFAEMANYWLEGL